LSIADTNSTFYTPQFADKYPLGKSLDETDKKRNLSYGKLAQLGPALSLRSGLEATDIGNPTGAVSEESALLPGVAQLGITRIERERLEARNVLNDMLAAGLKDADPNNVIINPTANSWGSLNNVFDQYSGISNFGMQVLAVSLILAMSLIIVTVFLLFWIASKPAKIESIFDKDSKFTKNSNHPGYDNYGRRTIGSYFGRGSAPDLGSFAGIIKALAAGQFNFWEMVGIQHTRNELQDCAVAGALSFFGIDIYKESTSDIGVAKSIGSSLAAGMQNPGFDSIVARSVSRSFLSISDALNGFKGTTTTGGLKKTFGLIEVLRDSKFMRALNVFAQLGDQVLVGNYDTYYDEEASKGGFGRKISEIDKKDDISLSTHTKNRLKDTLTIAWSSYRAPDMFIYPGGYLDAIKSGKAVNPPEEYHFPDKHPDNLVNSIKGTKEIGDKRSNYTDIRITTDLREKFEESLDSEYMPFYFHDVRTNEIVSFHAFLASLSDDYTASYDSVDAFGRIDPIKIYKNTHRKIGFSFYIAALSEEDFQIMWAKINKLVTLVYPQFTEGKQIVSDDGNYKITAPFSQLIGAAPMTRVRIGDLIQSNYSKFNLARLFGYTYPDSVISGSALYSSGSTYSSYSPTKEADEIKAEIENAKKTPGNYFFYKGPEIDLSFSNKSGLKPVPCTKTSKIIEGIVFEPIEAGRLALKPVIDKTADPKIQQDVKNYYTTISSNPNVNLANLSIIYRGDAYIAPTNSEYLVPTQDTLNKIKSKIESRRQNNSSQYHKNAEEFMIDDMNSNKGNIISKSFRTSGGRGLAGFIESMNFDWYDKVTWAGLGTPDPKNKRAPKMCKVTISFSPIHDITPGLDHMGANRAPVYPVGYLSPYNKNRK
jgi:hypothetical protein